MHGNQLGFHLARQEKRRMLDSQGVEDVFLKIRPQSHLCRSLDQYPGPVDANLVVGSVNRDGVDTASIS